MLTDAQLAQDFSILTKQYHDLVQTLLAEVGMSGIPLEAAPSSEGNFAGYDDSQFYVVRRGTVSVSYQGRIVYTLEEGDILLPDIGGSAEQLGTVDYLTAAGATLDCYPALEFMRRVLGDPSAMRLWSRVLVTYSGLMLRITSAFAPAQESALPQLEDYAAGDIIIRQGDRADDVYTMSRGVAEVLVDEVTVGRIGDGEIFGAIATLTRAHRSATVRAATACSVERVSREQFTELIRTKPATINSLLVDMANSIVNLNEQLVGLHGSHRLH